jgi:hypothetical protein
MREPEVMMPVRCPECGRESLCTLIVAVAADALLAGRQILLHADCHGREWEAGLSDREQLRECLAELVFATPEDRRHAMTSA